MRFCKLEADRRATRSPSVASGGWPQTALRICATVVRAIRSSALWGSFAIVSVIVPAAQSQSPTALAPAKARAGGEYVRLLGVRELREGRLLVVDGLGPRLTVVDWSTGTETDVTRLGDGPREIRSIGELVALPLDSSMFRDPRTARLHLVVGHEIVSSIAPDHPLWRHTLGGFLRGADAEGRVLVAKGHRYSAETRRIPGFANVSAHGAADSVVALLVDRNSGAIDTVATLLGQNRGLNHVTRSVRGQTIGYTLNNPLGVEEQSWLFPDGWIAIARLGPYRVEWRDATGRAVRGPSLPDDSIRVDETEKRFAIARQWRTSGIDWSSDAMPNWPKFLPPFLNDALVPLADGRLLIQRTLGARSTSRAYDLIDRRGYRVATLRVPLNTRIVGFGRTSVYAVVTGTDDVQTLQRHPWP